MYALATPDQLEQEVTIDRPAIRAQAFECLNIECGAVFSYRRVSLGRFVPPNFCPMCGEALEAEDGRVLDLMVELTDGLPDGRELRDHQVAQLPG